MAEAGVVRTGVGGWTFEPWRGVFYPVGLKQADELHYASRQLSAIEINSTYYSSQKPETFAKWRAATPEGFVFSVKASRFCTNRKVLSDAGESIQRFFDQGVTELGDRLGPVVWQFAPTKKFDRDDFTGFLDLLPSSAHGLGLRHCMEVRHPTFADPAFVALCREREVAICLADHKEYPLIPDVTAPFVYARLMTGSDDVETGYTAEGLDLWSERLTAYARGGLPADLRPLDRTGPPETPRDVFAFVIHEGKVRAPAGAKALLERIKAMS